MTHCCIRFIACFALLLGIAGLPAEAVEQNYSADWARAAGGSDVDEIVAADIDDAGNVYVTGRFVATAHFGGIELSVSTGLIGLFVAKLSPQGHWLWAVTPGDALATPTDIAVDENGVVYVAGQFANHLQIGNSSRNTATGALDPFVATLTSNGAWMWGAQGSGTTNLQANVFSVALNPSGGAFITGGFGTHLAFGSTTLTGGELFAASVDASGDWEWATAIDTPGYYAEGQGVAVDAAGNVLVCGQVRRTDVLPDDETIHDAILAKFDTAGDVVWTSYANGTGTNLPYPLGAVALSITVDSLGNAYIGGAAQQTVEFGAITVDAGSEVRQFLAKADPSGTWEWAIVGEEGYDERTSIWTTDEQSILVQLWSVGSNPLLGEFDSDGNLLHTHLLDADPQGRYVAAVDSDRSAILAGGYGIPITIGGFGLPDPAEEDAYVAKIVPQDLDQDLLSDYQESLWGTDPYTMDSDGDGVIDGTEVSYNTDPQDANDFVELPLDTMPVLAVALLTAAILAVWRVSRAARRA